MKEKFLKKLENQLGLTRSDPTARIFVKALAETASELIRTEWNATEKAIRENKLRRVYYFSAEFLTGRSLRMNLMNMGLWESAGKLAESYGFQLAELLEQEPDSGLGNGGLGRLASCFLDSLASLKLPAMGYGIRYRYGLFSQAIEEHRQREKPDSWVDKGDFWGVERPEDFRKIYIGGHVHMSQDQKGKLQFRIDPSEVIHAYPFDYPITGADGKNIGTMRLWEARSPQGFNLDVFNAEEHVSAWGDDDRARSLSAVLYPTDQGVKGKHLRLKQQYFFVSASLQDMTERFRRDFSGNWQKFPEQHVIQLNDTHPVLAIPELMRLLMDREGLSWETAWDICTRTFAYTNHTVLSEALETWPVTFIQDLFPRIAMIIEEIHKRLEDDLSSRKSGNSYKIIRNGLIHMAPLAIYGSKSVNGVAALHTEILKDSVLKDWYAVYPAKFNNKTNGITHRRWLIHSNPALTALIDKAIGQEWHAEPQRLSELKELTDDTSFLEELKNIKNRNKEEFSRYLKSETSLETVPAAIFDFQVKRIHEYKRQLLNILNIAGRYLELKESPEKEIQPRTFFIGGKAAPGYFIAKEIIFMANRVGEILRKDPLCRGKLQLIFLPNYRVSMAERIFPAAEISQQISTAGKEASGTGNMKFMMNGALTMGTMDGANIEIFEKSGLDNGYPFGLDTPGVIQMKESYSPSEFLKKNTYAAGILEAFEKGVFGPAEEFAPLLGHIRHNDEYLVLPELEAHKNALEATDRGYADTISWLKKSLLNIAGSGYFSSDRTIGDYNRDIWHLSPLESAPE